jgi:hypothetical protein
VVTKPLPRKATPMPPGKEITTPSGLKTQVLKRGTGAVAVAGKTVTVHYTAGCSRVARSSTPRWTGRNLSLSRWAMARSSGAGMRGSWG